MKKQKIIIGFTAFILIATINVYTQETDKTSAATILEETIKESGIEAASIKFKEMCTQKENYSFLQSEFLNLGNKFKRESKPKETIAVLNMIVEIFPDFDQAYLLLGQVYRSLGLHDKDLEYTNRAFEIRDTRILNNFINENKNSLATDAKEVIDNYLESIGGRDNLLKIKTIILTLTRLNSVNQETAFLRYYKYPYWYRQTIVRSGHSNVTDGKNVWRITSEGWKENPKSNFKYAPDIYSDFIDYHDRGISYKLLGIEVLDSEVLYHLLKTYQDGHTRDYYFSAESGLFVMERRDWGIGKDIKRYFDWRQVDGILIPYLFMVTNQGGLGHAHGAIIKDIKINTPLDDTLFIQQ